MGQGGRRFLLKNADFPLSLLSSPDFIYLRRGVSIFCVSVKFFRC